MTSIEQAREQWAPAGVYLNTASYGLPPRDGFDAMQAALADWRGGRTSWEHWGESGERTRAAFAEMVGVPATRVSIGATVSGFVGLVAASVPDGAHVIDARRFDTSPAWFSWVGAQPAIELLNRIGIARVYAHDVSLANRFRAGLGMEPSNSAIVSVADGGAAQRLERAGIVAALRGGRLRASWHLYKTEQDVDAALEAITG